MNKDYNAAIKRFLTTYGCSRAVLFSRAVDDIGVDFLKMPEAVRADIRRAYIAQSLPPANMMNIHPPVAWRQYYAPRKPRIVLPDGYCPERPTRP